VRIFIKCKDAAAYILAREDRPLTTHQTVHLKVHFLICKSCSNFEHQILTMRQVMGSWREQDQVPESTSAVNDS
jgi:hypothetical protein